METLNNKRRKDRRDIVPDALDTIGKVPPQAIDLEQAILGAMMLEKEGCQKGLQLLKQEYFYDNNNHYVFEAIKQLYEEDKPVDLLTVTEKLRLLEKLDVVGGPYYIAQLTGKVASAANIEYHSHIVIQKYVQRELIRITGETLAKSYSDSTDAFQLLDDTEKALYEVKNEGMKRPFQEIKDILGKAIRNIEENSAKKQDGITGVPTGIKELDKITAGWQPSDLIILAARPGMGKTALALTMMRNAAVDFDAPVAFFSLEMSSTQLVTRLIASETGLSSEKLKRGNLEDHEWIQLNTKIQTLSKAKIYIDDSPSISVFELKAKCRRLSSQFGVKLIMVDYLQLMKADESKQVGSREQEISYISRSLKEIAKELNVPVIALAQLSREVEKRIEKRPQLSDLRESGSIEQDADLVGFIYRPEYYQLTEDNGETLEAGYAEIMIKKHRNGPIADAKVKYVPTLQRFQDLDADQFSLPYTTAPSKMNAFTDEENLPSMPLDEIKRRHDNDSDTGAVIDVDVPF